MITATFITKMWLMLDTNSFVFLALLPCVLIQQYLHEAGLDLGLVVPASTFGLV